MTPHPQDVQRAREIWIEYQERRNDYRLTAVDLDTYFNQAVSLALSQARADQREKDIKIIKSICKHTCDSKNRIKICRGCIGELLIQSIRQQGEGE